MVTIQTINKVLESRVDFMVQFVKSMRQNDIPERLINYYIAQDEHFICDFCDKVDVEPDKYIQMYEQRLR